MKNYNCSVVGIAIINDEDKIANLVDLYEAEDEYMARGKAQSEFAQKFPDFIIQLTIVDEVDVVIHLCGKITATTTQALTGR